MRIHFVPAALIAAMAFGSAGFAATTATSTATKAKPAVVAMATSTATGTIKAFSKRHHTVTLDDGAVYRVSAKLKHPAFKVGEKITVTYRMSGKRRIAEAVVSAA